MKKTDDKLTLKLERAAIRRAKAYAKRHGISLSRLVEGYFNQISPPAPSAAEDPYAGVSENLRSIIGIIHVPDDFDWRKEYREHKIRKYSR